MKRKCANDRSLIGRLQEQPQQASTTSIAVQSPPLQPKPNSVAATPSLVPLHIPILPQLPQLPRLLPLPLPTVPPLDSPVQSAVALPFLPALPDHSPAQAEPAPFITGTMNEQQRTRAAVSSTDSSRPNDGSGLPAMSTNGARVVPERQTTTESTLPTIRAITVHQAQSWYTIHLGVVVSLKGHKFKWLCDLCPFVSAAYGMFLLHCVWLSDPML